MILDRVFDRLTNEGKAAVAAQRNERLATRNPQRLETQITELQALKERQGGKLGGRETRQLADLERDVARVRKARNTLGDRAPRLPQNREDGGGGRKRPHQDESETDEEVRGIPWPEDTPPPIPNSAKRAQHGEQPQNANMQPLGDRRLAEPPRQAKTTYESKAQVRDLRQEATRAFVPAVVQQKLNALKGQGRLLDEDELQTLESQGYAYKEGTTGDQIDSTTSNREVRPLQPTIEDEGE